MVCPTCQAENKDGAKFCKSCGTPLAPRCPSCGAPHEAGQRFCDECGSALETAPPVGNSGGAGPAVADAPAQATPVAHEPALAELRMVSVLFVDLVGFTSLSEAREAEDVRELLGRYFESARTIIERHGGTVEKFIGDAVMAVWGVPLAREDDAERAVRASLEIVDAVSAFGAEVGAPDLRARAGVVTGQVAALENPGEGLVVGDRVNTASRVQSAAAPGSVFVDEVTRQVTSAAIAYEDAGEHTVKGKAEPLRLWRAVRVVGGVGGSEREQGLDAAFVGREGDLRLVKELFHGALDRRSARLLAVTAEAGVGKSRLRREFFNYIDGLSSTVLWHLGRCLSHGEGVAYWALSEMVRQRLGIAEDASADDARARLESGLERWVPDPGDRAFLSPRLGALLGVAEPGLGREELFAGWRLFFERLADHEPVALVFEDLQWADAGLLDFIEQLLDWSAQSPIFILTLARPELAAGRDGWPAGHRGATLIRLEPLDDEAMRALLADLVDGLPDAATDQIIARAQGVPLYVIETVRALADRGVLAEHDGRLAPQGEIGELDVPASLSSLLSARLDSLDPAERGLVKAMSVFGGAFPRSAAAALGDVGEAELDAVLASLVRKGVLVIRTDRLSPDRGQFAFAQGLLRTVAYEMLSRQERKPRHLAAAEHLRRAFPDDGEDVAEVIATHYLDAYRAATGDPDEDELRRRTLDALRRAGQRAATVGAPEGAERTYRTAAELASEPPERAELTRAAGEMAFKSGRLEPALELLEEAQSAFAALPSEGADARVFELIARTLIRLGRLTDAVERLGDALGRLGPEVRSSDAATLNAQLARALFFAGDYRASIERTEIALELAQALKLPEVLCEALTQKGNSCLYTGRAEEARILYTGARELAERHGLSAQLQNVMSNLVNLGLMWDVPDAITDAEASLSISRRNGDRYGETVSAGNILSLLLQSGRWVEADGLIDELLGRGDDRPGASFIAYRKLVLEALRGNTGEAGELLARVASWNESGDEELQSMFAAATVNVLLAEEEPERALSTAHEQLWRYLDSLSPASEAGREGWPMAVEAARRVGRPEAIADLIEVMAAHPPGHIPPYLAAQLARARGLAAAMSGEHDAAEAELGAAIDTLRALGYPYWLAVVQTDVAEWLVGQHRGGEAEPLLEEAIAVLRELGARPALERAQQLHEPAAETRAPA